jgi:hypothetical protein
MTVIGAAGITWRVARVWWGADRAFERRLKNRHGAGRFCPICRGELQLELDWWRSLRSSWTGTHSRDSIFRVDGGGKVTEKPGIGEEWLYHGTVRRC